MTYAFIALALTALLAMVMVPTSQTSATSTREGGACGSPDGCHDNGGTNSANPSLMTVTGLPVGNYVPGMGYSITITIVDGNGGSTGQNAFDMLVTGGTISSTDANVETNTPPAGYSAEASQNDGVVTKNAVSWSLTWTAPLSGSVRIDIWSIVGDGTSGTADPYDFETYSYNTIPEFPFLLLPIIGVGAVVVLVARASKRQ